MLLLPTTSILRPGILRTLTLLRPILLRLRTQLPPRQLLQPALLPLHLTHLKIILLPALSTKHLLPPLNRTLNLLLRLPHFLLAIALLCSRHTFRARLGDIERYVRPFCAAEIGRAVFGEAAGDEAACCVFAGEDVVAASGAVDAAAGGDVVDGAVEGEVDGSVGVGAVVVD
jgi:hypothetical protein